MQKLKAVHDKYTTRQTVLSHDVMGDTKLQGV